MKQTNSHNQVMAVALTGHRSIPYDKVPSLRKALRTVILEHYNRGIRIFYCGMAMGFDLLAAETALSMKEVYSDITLVATVPYRGQCENSHLIIRNAIVMLLPKRMKLSYLQKAMLMTVSFGETTICCHVPAT